MKTLILFVLTAILLISQNTFAQEDPKELFEKSWTTNDTAEKRVLREKIIELSPDSEYGLFCKAWFKTEKDEFEAAVELLNDAIKLNNEFWQAYYHRGNTYGALKNYQNAVSDISKALDINPGYGAGYFVRGATYVMGLGNIEKGCEDFQKAVSLGYEKAGEYINKFCK